MEVVYLSKKVVKEFGICTMPYGLFANLIHKLAERYNTEVELHIGEAKVVISTVPSFNSLKTLKDMSLLIKFEIWDRFNEYHVFEVESVVPVKIPVKTMKNGNVVEREEVEEHFVAFQYRIIRYEDHYY